MHIGKSHGRIPEDVDCTPSGLGPEGIDLGSLTRLAFHLNRSYQCHLDRAVADWGISSAHVPVLSYLWAGNSGVTQNEIARSLGVDKGTISRTIRVLVNRGFVTQSTCKQDSRACQIALTDLGGMLQEPFQAAIADWNAAVIGPLSTKQRDSLVQALTDVTTRSIAFAGNAPTASDAATARSSRPVFSPTAALATYSA